MSEEYYDGILLIDAQDDPRISDEEAAALQPIQKAFMESYIANREKMPVEEWLPGRGLGHESGYPDDAENRRG